MKALALLLLSAPAYAQVLIEPLNPLPEPSTWALLSIGAVLLIRYGNKKLRGPKTYSKKPKPWGGPEYEFRPKKDT